MKILVAFRSLYTPARMHPHRLKFWTFWLLPLLIARLFVPEGFMVGATAQGLSVMLCPAYAPLPQGAGAMAMPMDHMAHMNHAGMDHSAHAMHGMQGDAAGMPSGHGQHDRTPCPFALAGAGIVCPAVASIGELYAFADRFPIIHADPAWISLAVLIDRIRGPPLV